MQPIFAHKRNMIGIVIVTHGRLAAELLSAVQHVVGPQTHVKTVCIGPNDDMEERRNEITAAIKAVDLGSGVVIVTDMFGGTPCNLALTHLQKNKVEVLAGANLPSLIKLISVRITMPLEQAVCEAIESGRKYMRAGSAELAGGVTGK
ncbi:MAG TPA: PTS sugar transporter subunit IIA [Micropepsaceae bacterium]|nr:PTS sugar transporter subunit IIA [Micropepsaceae bacterium]